MSVKQTESKITALYERLSRDDDNAGDISQRMKPAFPYGSDKLNLVGKLIVKRILTKIFWRNSLRSICQSRFSLYAKNGFL